MVKKQVERVGLLATQNIRGGASREVLNHITETGSIFFAVSDREWVLDGAMVHIAMIGFDRGQETTYCLDGRSVERIYANLSSGTDTTKARRLVENRGCGFIGSCKGGSFDITEAEAIELLLLYDNSSGLPNSDVIRPVMNSRDLLGRIDQRWIIDNADLDLPQASLYKGPHTIVEERVRPERSNNRDAWLRENWWRPQRMRAEMRAAISPLTRFLVTPTTSKHRIFVWLHRPVLPDHKLVVFARSDDFFFGVLQSRLHEIWAQSLGTQLRERESGLNYNVQSSFETFPLPQSDDDQKRKISLAAQNLSQMRIAWLNPTEWVSEKVLEFPASISGPWSSLVEDVDQSGIGTARYSQIVPKNTNLNKPLRQRTLTNLYNQRPDWLDLAHRKLDEAVLDAYGWPHGLSDEEILERLLALNLERSPGQQK